MKKAGLFLTLIATFVLAGCAGLSGRGGSGELEAPVVGLYKLRSMDPLQISLLGIPDEKQLDTVIDERGNITLPYINDPIQANGLTTSELERKIQKIYTEGEIYRSITVNVATSAKSYYMEGEVSRPQEYPLTRRITLLQAIAASGGYTDYANKKNISITRNGKIMKFNGKELERHPERDVPVEAGDRINIHRSLF
jgi:polysaccharide export outer membrane protein